MSIFNFNHIDKNKTKEEIQEIKELYKYYHYRYWCYQKAYTHYKKVNLASNIVSAGLVIIGSVAGGITANPIIIGTITGAGVLLKTFRETKARVALRPILLRFVYSRDLNLSTHTFSNATQRLRFSKNVKI